MSNSGRPVHDSYQRFFQEYLTKERFFEFGVKEIIYGDLGKVRDSWNALKYRIVNGGDKVYIRGFGRNASGSQLYLDFYKYLFPKAVVEIDPTNNYAPTTTIKEMTGYAKQESRKYTRIMNYQVSHVFGRTKNVYLFTAPWNIVYLPKLLDPLTGHESKGVWAEEFTSIFQRQIFEKFEEHIGDYNELVTTGDFTSRLDEGIQSLKDKYTIAEVEKLASAVKTDFSIIDV